MTMTLQYDVVSDIGGRSRNQDAYGVKMTNDESLFVVCDGLGAYEHSELAARYFCDALEEQLEDHLDIIRRDVIQGIESLFTASQTQMTEKLKRSLKHSPEEFAGKTTCVMAYLSSKNTVFAHVGDSRAYRLYKGKSVWRTIDHSFAQNLLESGEIEGTELNNHPLRNMLTQCIEPGLLITPTLSVQEPLKAGEALVLCSDGFWENVTPRHFSKLFSSKNTGMTLNSMVQGLKKTVENLDNNTVIFIRYTQSK